MRLLPRPLRRPSGASPYGELIDSFALWKEAYDRYRAEVFLVRAGDLLTDTVYNIHWRRVGEWESSGNLNEVPVLDVRARALWPSTEVATARWDWRSPREVHVTVAGHEDPGGGPWVRGLAVAVRADAARLVRRRLDHAESAAHSRAEREARRRSDLERISGLDWVYDGTES